MTKAKAKAKVKAKPKAKARERWWGCELPENERALEALATRLHALLRRLVKREAKVLAMREFLDSYFEMGATEDITDTIIRDNVWVFLLKENKGVMTELALDELWEGRKRASERLCVVM